MKFPVTENLAALAEACSFPLYAVGGSVRDHLAGFPLSEGTDWDICAAATEEELLAACARTGFTVKSVYRNTGTVKLADRDGIGYEFTRFRSDKYVRGEHVPSAVEFTDDIGADARRRDFTVNAVYYEIGADAFRDPLGGIEDVAKKRLRTVAPASKVFGEDGLRLMRLARLAAETGFRPDEECTAGAKEHCALVGDIAPERIFRELDLLLHADGKHGEKTAPYRGLKLLKETGVLARIMPELALGDGMFQRADFHDHDVLEHSLRCVLYSPPQIRYAALLHDVGKPYCMKTYGKYHAHAEEGERIAREILTRLKAPKSLTDETVNLVKLHMRDYDLQMKESKVRLEIFRCYPLLDDLLALRQADYSACKDDLSPAPSVLKWRKILAEMQEEGAPLTVRDLKVNGLDFARHGVPPQRIGEALREFAEYCVLDGARNDRPALLKRIEKLYPEET